MSNQTRMRVLSGSCLNAASLSASMRFTLKKPPGKRGKNTALTVTLQKDPRRDPLQKPRVDAQPEVARLLPGARRGQACLMMQPSCQLIYK